MYVIFKLFCGTIHVLCVWNSDFSIKQKKPETTSNVLFIQQIPQTVFQFS